MSIANQEMIRNNNRRLVLEFIINNPPVSRAELAKQLSLTKQPFPILYRNYWNSISSGKSAVPKPPWEESPSCWSLTKLMVLPCL